MSTIFLYFTLFIHLAQAQKSAQQPLQKIPLLEPPPQMANNLMELLNNTDERSPVVQSVMPPPSFHSPPAQLSSGTSSGSVQRQLLKRSPSGKSSEKIVFFLNIKRYKFFYISCCKICRHLSDGKATAKRQPARRCRVHRYGNVRRGRFASPAARLVVRPRR